MKLVIMSCFRNAAGMQIQGFFHRIGFLKDMLSHHRMDIEVKLILAYGDSTDSTASELWEQCKYAHDAILLEVNHGGPEFKSVENAVRFANLSFVANSMLGALAGLNLSNVDIAAFVESDIIWEPTVMLKMINSLIKQYDVGLQKSIIAPMIWELSRPGEFYDVFAFRKDGQRFKKKFPFHPVMENLSRLIEIDSAGSFIVGHSRAFKEHRFPEKGTGEAIVGFCNSVREGGGKIYICQSESVFHP